MKIGIDLHTLTNFKQGTHTFTSNLVEELLALDRDNRYYLYITDKNEGVLEAFSRPNVTFSRVVPHQRLIRIPISLPVKLAYDGIDVFHCQYMAPLTAVTPIAVAMHDIIHEYMPELYPRNLCRMMRVLYPLSVRKARHVLTISEHSKQDIMKYYGVPPEKITVTYCGVSKAFSPIDDQAAIGRAKHRYGISGPYIYYVGRLEPRKNLLTLIRAYHALRQRGVDTHTLVLSGMKYYQYERLHALVVELGLQREVIFTGGVEDAELPLLINGASAFAYPTLAEGFGLPPLEAMACGTPVVTSNLSSLPEVVGDAGLLVDPLSVDELSSAIERIITDSELRASLRAKGLIQAGRFSWRDTANRTLEVFKRMGR